MLHVLELREQHGLRLIVESQWIVSGNVTNCEHNVTRCQCLSTFGRVSMLGGLDVTEILS